MKLAAALATLLPLASAAVLWDGRLNDLSSATDLDSWSWSNQVGPYQWYIHGSSATTSYVDLSADHKNPADDVSEQGARLTLDDTAFWNGQTMRRTELIPQTTAAINEGKVFYHFSMMRKDENAPSTNKEHQIAFFESHFTEMKYGWISGDQGEENVNLQFMVGGQGLWEAEWEADVWHNIAYEIVSCLAHRLSHFNLTSISLLGSYTRSCSSCSQPFSPSSLRAARREAARRQRPAD